MSTLEITYDIIAVIDYCVSSPCQNGGNCVKRLNGYTCYCQGRYTGVHCQRGKLLLLLVSIELLLFKGKPEMRFDVALVYNHFF